MSTNGRSLTCFIHESVIVKTEDVADGIRRRRECFDWTLPTGFVPKLLLGGSLLSVGAARRLTRRHHLLLILGVNALVHPAKVLMRITLSLITVTVTRRVALLVFEYWRETGVLVDRESR